MKVRFLTVKQLAQMLRYSVQTIRNLIRNGQIPARRFGKGRYRVNINQVKDLIPELSTK